VLQGLYQWRVGGADEAAIEAQMPRKWKASPRPTANSSSAPCAASSASTKSWSSRLAPTSTARSAELSPVEACVLMMGSFELVNHPETPYRVIINEAIELTKAFGGTDGHKYVNGVLDKVAAVVRPVEVAARKQAKSRRWPASLR
jgi:N utilization substance protein B